ncbi:RNA-binding protein 45-like [Papilio machaon]|uniref:RNA-binding protein 45-like n=1 Tax=Papilio machaon TaxID=76193 RepID=UPI001E6654F7|nr:RNA-binding protein 45-like [Papilio machaon]
MSTWNQVVRNDERKEDKPPHSTIFVVCGKQTKEEDLRPPFEQFGTIEDIYIPKDRTTGETKGVAYIKYNKTSSAALAIQELHLKTLKSDSKPIIVMVAVNRNDSNSCSEDRYTRLFIKVHKDATESEIKQHFFNFGLVESVHLQKDKFTEANKGFAYVNYKTFFDAAKAYEECDRKYRPMFATPKEELKRSRNSLEMDSFHSSNSPCRDNYVDRYHHRDDARRDILNGVTLTKPFDFNRINVKCYPPVPQRYIEQLFNVVPGMKNCQYTLDTYNGVCKALITYDHDKEAAFAMERLNNFEFPSGEIITVWPDKNPLNKAAAELSSIVNNFKNAIDAGSPNLVQLADAIAEASTLIKVVTCTSEISKEQEHDMNYCSTPLPPPQPLANNASRVVQRCFIVCKPQPPPSSVLRDVFCRFGDLIHVSTFPNKIFGFAKYASIKSAQEAIKCLNGAVVCGIRLKVMEADEKPTKNDDDQRMNDDEQNDNRDNDIDRKRIRLIDSSE